MPESLATWHCLLKFQRQRGLAAPLMEIGVYYGKSAALLALHSTQKEEIYRGGRIISTTDSTKILPKFRSEPASATPKVNVDLPVPNRPSHLSKIVSMARLNPGSRSVAIVSSSPSRRIFSTPSEGN
jgi:hypothetical protein